MRTIMLALLGLLLVACGRETVPQATAPTRVAAAQEVEPGSQIEPAEDTGPTGPAGPQVIPDDFPLADGYPAVEDAEPGPDFGLEPPSRTGPPLQLAPCGTAVPLPAHTDLLRAGWVGPEDGRARQLVTFAGWRDAAAYVDSVLAAYAACPEHVRPDGTSGTRNTVTGTGLGDQGAAVSTQYTTDGQVTPGLETLHVVRVGPTVLLSVTGNEGGAGPDPEAARARQVAEGAAAITGVLDAMRSLAAVPAEPAFGPDGFGQVELGMAAAEVTALAGVRVGPVHGRCRTFEAAGVSGLLEQDRGVVSLTVRADLETPERVTPHASLRELRATYPAGTWDDPVYLAPVPGRDDRHYRFEVPGSLDLVLDDQHCAD